MNATIKTDLHARVMRAAKACIRHHIEEYDGQACFNLFTFLEAVESRITSITHAPESPTGDFVLAPDHLARYAWCCLALESGGRPDGHTFRGMPILD